MAEKIALEIFIEADKANLSLGELQEGFEAINEELKNTEKGTERFNELSTAMVNTSKEVKNLEASFEGLDNQQLADEFTTLAGGITDVTAAFILMGGESETIDELAGSIQTAMAVSMGFKGAIDGVSSGMKIYNDLAKSGKIATIAKSIAEKTAAAGTWLLATAQTALNAIMSANPIALIVLAVAGLVTAFVLLGGSIKKLIQFAFKPFQIQIDLIVDALQWLGIMESDTAIATREAEEAKAAAVEKATKKRIELYEKEAKEIEALSDIRKQAANVAIADINREIALATAQGKSVEDLTVKKINAKVDEAYRVYQEDLKLFNLQSKLIEDREKIDGFYNQAKYDEDRKREDSLYQSLVASGEALDEANNQAAIFNATQIEDNRKANEAGAAINKEIWEAGAADRAMAASKESQAKKNALMEDIVIGKKVQELQTEELDRHSIHIEGLKTNEEILHDAKNFWHNKDLERIAEENAARRESAQIALDLAMSTLAEISSVAGAYADADVKAEEERFNNLRATKQLTEKQLAAEELKTAQIKDAIRKKQFENEKKMQLATAAINGAQALVSIFAQYPKFDGGFAMIAALASAAITTASSIAKIKATTFSSTPSAALATLPSGDVSPDGAGSGGAGAQIDPVSNTSTILGDQQVYVTETDITSTQNNVSVIEESATF